VARGRRRQSPVKSCVGKKRYDTRESAEETIKWILEQEDAEEDLNLKVYFCGFCSGYHLAKKRSK
jgi:hypothetical protein